MSKKDPTAPADTPANPAPAAGASHEGNDAARQSELRALGAEASLKEQDAPSKAEQTVTQQAESEAERKHREARDAVLMVAKPCFDLGTPNWRATFLDDKALTTWADGITPAVLKYFPDIDEKLPPELVALLITAMTFAPVALQKVPARVPEQKPEDTPA